MSAEARPPQTPCASAESIATAATAFIEFPAPANGAVRVTQSARLRTWTPGDRIIGLWSSAVIVLLNTLYIVTGGVWLVMGGAQSAAPLEPADPYLAILESIIVLLAPALVILLAVVHAYAPPERKTLTQVALALTTVFSALTCCVHFLQLAVVRRWSGEGIAGDSLLRMYPWPSLMLTLDFLAWDFFFGLALLFAAPAFDGDRLQDSIRTLLRLSGTLCVSATFGSVIGDLRLQCLGIIGYAGVFPLACALLYVLWRRCD
jgi:hypothetical protein